MTAVIYLLSRNVTCASSRTSPAATCLCCSYENIVSFHQIVRNFLLGLRQIIASINREFLCFTEVIIQIIAKGSVVEIRFTIIHRIRAKRLIPWRYVHWWAAINLPVRMTFFNTKNWGTLQICSPLSQTAKDKTTKCAVLVRIKSTMTLFSQQTVNDNRIHTNFCVSVNFTL